MHHAGRVVAPTELAEHLYDSGNDRDPNAIEVIVARLRRKLGSGVIETRRGFGYFRARRTYLMGNSIRFRLWSAATISILVALAIAGVGLRYLFELNVERRIVSELTVDLNELIGATSFAADGRLSVRAGSDRPAVHQSAVRSLLAGGRPGQP